MKHVVEEQEAEGQGQGHSEEERSVLGALKGHGKKQKVGSIRTGEAKKSEKPGAYPGGERQILGSNSKGAKFAIFTVILT